jgi:hypothetical protein
MSSVTVCDQCGKHGREGHTLNWWKIEPLDEWLVYPRMSEPPWHCCSWECVAAFATERQKDKEPPQ